MADSLVVNFRWSIGDLVISRATLAEAQALWRIGEMTLFAVGRIVSRRVEECVGGVQMFYGVEFQGRQLLCAEDSLIEAAEYFDEYVRAVEKRRSEKDTPDLRTSADMRRAGGESQEH